MPLAFYMDQNVPKAITTALRLRNIKVITAYEDGCSQLNDEALLERATELSSVLFTRDDDLIAEAAQKQKEGKLFNGVIYAHQLHVSIGKAIDDLEIIAKAGEPNDLINRVVFLPL